MQEHKIWMEFALDDLKHSQATLKSSYISIPAICYHSQQAAEKALKAFLVLKKIKPRRTHDLPDLLQECMNFDIEFLALKEDVFELNPYIHKTRYPDSGINLDLSVAQDAVRRAKKIYEFVLTKLEVDA